MGIKFFYKWLSNYKDNRILFVREKQRISDAKFLETPPIHNLLIDMNGLIHNSAQKIYKYGAFEEQGVIIEQTPENDLKLFNDIGKSINALIFAVQPKRRIVMNIDGSAPLAKQNQQRQRRYKSAMDACEKSVKNKSGISLNKIPFDPCNITPGTKFMHDLSVYLDGFIKRELLLSALEIVFSDSSVPGEGEHALFAYIRKFVPKTEANCLYANDADLIMLSLTLHRKNVFVIRDSLYDKRFKYHLVNIDRVREIIIENVVSDPRGNITEGFGDNVQDTINEKKCINDYIFLFFLIGNDFLPNIPAFEINMNGVEILFDIYRQIVGKYGHIIYRSKKGLNIRKKSFLNFLKKFGEMEQRILNEKYINRSKFFTDEILESSIEKRTELRNPENLSMKSLLDALVSQNMVNMGIYKEKYYKEKLGIETPDEIRGICMEYFQGLQWTLEYYSQGPTDWRWFYPYNYAPFASDLCQYIFRRTIFLPTKPIPPFLQLSIVCHKNSYNLLPKPFRDNEKIKEYCPEKVKIDLSGKQREWEGLVILPTIDLEKYIKNYREKIKLVPEKEMYRNEFGVGYLYQISPDGEFHTRTPIEF
jgi:5'-3' exonuclease